MGQHWLTKWWHLLMSAKSWLYQYRNVHANVYHWCLQEAQQANRWERPRHHSEVLHQSERHALLGDDGPEHGAHCVGLHMACRLGMMGE